MGRYGQSRIQRQRIPFENIWSEIQHMHLNNTAWEKKPNVGLNGIAFAFCSRGESDVYRLQSQNAWKPQQGLHPHHKATAE